MSIMTLYLVTIATHLLEFFSNRLEKQTNKQTKTENLFCGRRGQRGGWSTAVSIPNPFSMLELKESLKSEEKLLI